MAGLSDVYGDLYDDLYGTFPPGMRVEVDWDKDGNFTDPGEDVTARVRPRIDAITLQYGRDQSTALAPTVSGQGSLTLDNRSRDYSPRNADSPLYGNLKPARPVRISRTIGLAVFILFRGHTDDSPINPDPNSKTVRLSLVDSLADFRGQSITTPLYRDIRTGEAIGYILDACGWPADARDLDVGATVIRWWWEDGTDALTALDKVVRSEGPPAMLTVGSAGEIIFRDRHHRLTEDESLTSQGTWRGVNGLEPVMSAPFSIDEAWSNIINTGTASVDVRQPAELQPVWTSDAVITLSSGEQRLVTASASDPFLGAVVPVAGTDYVLTSGTVTMQLLRTSGLSAAIVITAVGGPAVISTLQLRAQPVSVAYTVQVSASDSASIEEYGSRSMPGDLPWCDIGDAQAVVSLMVAQRAHPLPVVSARFVIGRNTARAVPVLARDLSDRVRIIETESQIDADFYIESIQHEFTGEDDHAVTFGLEAVPTYTANVFRFDDATAGFNLGVFSSGLDLSATMFRFDTSGQGFNAGAFAA